MRKFTLIELLVIVAIIGILITMLMPALSKARSKAKEAVCLSNEKQLGIAFTTYADNSNGYFPVYANNFAWDDHLSDMMALNWSQSDKSANGLSDASASIVIFQCPGDEVAPANNTKFRRSYAVNEYKPNGGNDTYYTKALPGLISTSKDHPNQSVNISNVLNPHKVVLAAEQWRNWNMIGTNSAQINGYGYSKLKYDPTASWWTHYQCHGDGRANILMVDGSAQMRKAQTMLNGSENDTANDYRGSWLDHLRN